MKKKFHFKEMFDIALNDILSSIFIVVVFGGSICSIPFVMAVILTYLKISTFGIAFCLSLTLEILIAGFCCIVRDLKEKYYY